MQHQRVAEGVWLGRKWGSQEHLIGTPSGIRRSRAIMRKPRDHTWDAEKVLATQGTPWSPEPREAAPPTEPEVIHPQPELHHDERINMPVPRRVKIYKSDLETWGYTSGCPRCMATMRGLPCSVTHNDVCRNRIQSEMDKDVKERERD